MLPHAVVVAEGVRDSDSFVGDGMNGIIYAEFLFVYFGFGGTTYFDDCDFAVKGGGAFLKVFFFIFAFS